MPLVLGEKAMHKSGYTSIWIWAGVLLGYGLLTACSNQPYGSDEWADPWANSYSRGSGYGYAPGYGYGSSGNLDNDAASRAQSACRQAAAERGIRVVSIEDVDARGDGDYRVKLKGVTPAGKTAIRCDYDRQGRYARIAVPTDWGGGPSPYDPGQVDFGRAKQACRQAAVASGLRNVDVNGARAAGGSNAQVFLDGKRGGGGRERLSCVYDGSNGQANLGR